MSIVAVKPKDHFKIVVDWLASNGGAKNFAKIFTVANKWIKHFDLPKPKTWDATTAKASEISNILSVANIPKSLSGTISNTAKFIETRKPRAALDAVGDFTSLVGYSSGAAVFFHGKGVVTVSEHALGVIKKIGGPCLLLGAGWGAYKNGEKISKLDLDPSKPNKFLKEHRKATLYLMRLAISVSYVAMAACSILSAFFAVKIAPIVLILLATSALLFSISSHFYNKIVEPEK